MMYTIIKLFISAGLIVLIAEIGKRSSLLGALLASLPLISILAMIWLYIDTKNIEEIALFSKNIFWLVLPSLVLFISLPIFLHWRWPFYLSLLVSCLLTALAYWCLISMLKLLGVTL